MTKSIYLFIISLYKAYSNFVQPRLTEMTMSKIKVFGADPDAIRAAMEASQIPLSAIPEYLGGEHPGRNLLDITVNIYFSHKYSNDFIYFCDGIFFLMFFLMYRVFSDINNIQYSLYGTCILHTNFVSMLLLQRELIDARAAAKAAAATAGTVAEGGAKEEGAAAK